jgi:hypothetical protein
MWQSTAGARARSMAGEPTATQAAEPASASAAGTPRDGRPATRRDPTATAVGWVGLAGPSWKRPRTGNSNRRIALVNGVCKW